MMFSSSSVLSIGRGEAPRRSATAREPLKKRATCLGRPLFSIGRLLRLILRLLMKFPGLLLEFPSLLSELVGVVEHFLLSRSEQRSDLLSGFIPHCADFRPLFLPDGFDLRLARLNDLPNLLPLLIGEI